VACDRIDEGLINPIVLNGVVELWGTITDERQRRALVVAAENVPGVKAARDRLAWVECHFGDDRLPIGRTAGRCQDVLSITIETYMLRARRS
jgi:hypothetical protein